MHSKSDINILAIESSCDDTAAAVMINGNICSNVVAGQKVHAQYGGVIPELASRAHQQHIVPVVHQALKEAKLSVGDLSAIAFTQGPGLLGSLMVGASFAKGLSLATHLPLIGVNHLEGHVLSHFIEFKDAAFPYLCLLVSGGHTQIVRVDASDTMEIIGRTRDDAAGEAFDKAAKMMGLPYPGGPYLDRLAVTGNPLRFKFPDSKVGNLDFSFSGIKTAILYFIQGEREKDPDFVERNLNDLCASIQHTIVSYLMRKLMKAVQLTGIRRITISGGVSANSALRMALQEAAIKNKWQTYIPSMEYCTDNAAMVAMAAHFQYLNGAFVNQSAVPYARIPK